MPEVRQRFGALQPQRNTRLGAAIRHAGRELGAVPARVRLLLILSDGFPNHTGYKGGHAVADAHRALLELQGRGIRFHALTVNLPADAQLDALYGRARHHVISDVQELPGRLLTVYRADTIGGRLRRKTNFGVARLRAGPAAYRSTPRAALLARLELPAIQTACYARGCRRNE